jgi:hypothetical protein
MACAERDVALSFGIFDCFLSNVRVGLNHDGCSRVPKVACYRCGLERIVKSSSIGAIFNTRDFGRNTVPKRKSAAYAMKHSENVYLTSTVDVTVSTHACMSILFLENTCHTGCSSSIPHPFQPPHPPGQRCQVDAVLCAANREPVRPFGNLSIFNLQRNLRGNI